MQLHNKLMTVTSNTEEEEEGGKNSTQIGIETSFHTYILSLKLSGTPLKKGGRLIHLIHS